MGRERQALSVVLMLTQKCSVRGIRLPSQPFSARARSGSKVSEIGTLHAQPLCSFGGDIYRVPGPRLVIGDVTGRRSYCLQCAPSWEPGSIGTGVLSEWQFSQRRTARGLAYPQVVEWCAEEGSEPMESQSLPESPGQALLGWQQGVGCWLPL